MWNRQNPAYMISKVIKLLSFGTAAAGALYSLYLFANSPSSAAANLLLGATAAFMLTAAVITWRCSLWHIGRSLDRQQGTLTIERYIFRSEALTALEIKHSPFLSLFRSVRVSCVTSADRERDISRSALIVNRDEGRRIAGRLMPMDKGRIREYHASRADILLLALSQADAFSGLLLSIPLISWLAKYIDSALSARLYSALEITGRIILPDVSPVLSAAALLPAAGWLVHMLITMFSYGRLRFVLSGKSVMLGRGILIRKTVCFPLGAATAIESQRTLLTGLFRRESNQIIIPGYGSCLILPPTDQRSSAIETAALFPHGEFGMRIDTVNRSLWWRWWAAGGAAVLIITMRFALTAGIWRGMVLLCGIPAATILFWRAAIGSSAGKNAAVRVFADSVELTGVRRLRVCRLRVLRGCIASVKVTQNIIQQSTGLCSLYIRPHGSQYGLRCCHLPLDRCLSLIGRLG